MKLVLLPGSGMLRSILDPGVKLLAFVTLGTAMVFGAVWAFKRLFGTPRPDPTGSPEAIPFTAGLDDSHTGHDRH